MREQQKYRAAVYCRISSDDGPDHESMSIGNQRSLLTEYVDRQGWEIVDTYIDDGFSGTNFDRPGFQRMIADIERACQSGHHQGPLPPRPQLHHVRSVHGNLFPGTSRSVHRSE